MSEPFNAMEEMIRSLAEDFKPSVSLRHRVLAASQIARERQLKHQKIRRNVCWTVLSLCVIYAGSQVQWSEFQSFRVLRDGQPLAVMTPVFKNVQVSVVSDCDTEVDQSELAPSFFNDPIEWETAESHWKQRDRQSTLISHYF